MRTLKSCLRPRIDGTSPQQSREIATTGLIVVALKRAHYVKVLDRIEQLAICGRKCYHEANTAKEVDDIWVPVDGSSVDDPDRIRARILAHATALRLYEVLAALEETLSVKYAGGLLS